MKQLAYFSELPPKTEFSLNGNRFVKHSTRTARLPYYDRWFYMTKTDRVVVGVYSRISHDYFGAVKK